MTNKRKIWVAMWVSFTLTLSQIGFLVASNATTDFLTIESSLSPSGPENVLPQVANSPSVSAETRKTPNAEAQMPTPEAIPTFDLAKFEASRPARHEHAIREFLVACKVLGGDPTAVALSMYPIDKNDFPQSTRWTVADAFVVRAQDIGSQYEPSEIAVGVWAVYPTNFVQVPVDDAANPWGCQLQKIPSPQG